MIFFSGADKIPPIGFEQQPTLGFLLSKEAILPTSSTCDLTLRIPTVHSDYHHFREYMLLGILGNDGFGGV